MTTTPKAALLREAAQNALITLDGIASANPRDKADFETPDEWIAWAKSRARFAADALRAPVAQEVYAERILRQMLHESDQTQSMQAEPAQAGELPDLSSVIQWLENGCDPVMAAKELRLYKAPIEQARAALSARKPAVPLTPLIDKHWYWISYEGLDQTFHAAAMYKSNVDCFYSYEFAGIPARQVKVHHGIGLEVKP